MKKQQQESVVGLHRPKTANAASNTIGCYTKLLGVSSSAHHVAISTMANGWETTVAGAVIMVSGAVCATVGSGVTFSTPGAGAAWMAAGAGVTYSTTGASWTNSMTTGGAATTGAVTYT